MTEKSALTSPAPDKSDDAREEPLSAMQRINALEKRVATVERALTVAFGDRWLHELKGGDESTG